MPIDLKYGNMPYIIDQMRMAKKKSGYSDAALVADLNSFSSRNWDEAFITRLLAGTLQPNTDAVDVFEKYLLARFYQYNSS